MGSKKSASATDTLFSIAEAQRPPVPVDGEEPPRVVLKGRGLLERVGLFITRTLANKDSYKALLEARDRLSDAARPLFEQACEDAGELLPSADLAGGTIRDADEEAVDPTVLEVFDGDVQLICQVEPRDVEIGSDAEKELTAGARRLMPEGFRLELKCDLVDPAERERLVSDLGPERIERWFKVKPVRSAPDAEAVRKLFGRGRSGRRTLEALKAAKAVIVKQFPKLAARTGK